MGDLEDTPYLKREVGTFFRDKESTKLLQIDDYRDI